MDGLDMKLYKRILFFLFLLLLEVLLIAQERQSIYHGDLVKTAAMKNVPVTLLLQLPNFATCRTVSIPISDSSFAVSAFQSDGFAQDAKVRFAVAYGSDTVVVRPLGLTLLFNGTTLPMPPPLINVRLFQNQKPTIKSVPTTIAQVGTDYRYTIVVSDPENDPLQFKLLTAPAWLKVDSLGLVRGVPSDTGNFAIEIEVSDGYRGLTTQKFVLRSYPPNDVDLTDREKTFTLNQNFPNPFNPSTTITFELKESAEVILSVVNSLGEVIASERYGKLSPGEYSEMISLTQSSGVYYYRLLLRTESGEVYSKTKSMMFIK